jgi:hypothetical protein
MPAIAVFDTNLITGQWLSVTSFSAWASLEL